MTKQESEMRNLIAEDNKIRETYKSMWTKNLTYTIIAVLVAVGVGIQDFMTVDHDVDLSVFIRMVLWIWMLIFPLLWFMLAGDERHLTDELTLNSTGKKVESTPYIYFCKALSAILSFIPVYVLLVVDIKAFDYVTGLYASPLVFFAVIGITWYENTTTARTFSPGIRSEEATRKGWTSMGLSVHDYESLRGVQELAGLDPDKINIFDSSAMDMSINDWRALGDTMELAGFDVKKKK